MNRALVEIDHVTKRFGNFVAVNGIVLEIGEGEFLAIMGSSGCGKSTTLRMLASLDQPTEGELRLKGERINERMPWEQDTPLVWQNLALFPFLNVIENVEFGLRMRGVGKTERRERAGRWLENMGISELANRHIADISGGQRQRVALARSLVTEPPILLLDEPLSALDASLKIRMQGVLSRLQKEVGITFVYVTHSHSEAFAMADRVVIMKEGGIEQIGTPKAIYNHPRNRFVAEFLGGKNIIDGRVDGIDELGVATVESRHGTFKAPLREGGPQPGDRSEVAICVGADRMNIDQSDGCGSEGLECTIVSEEFVGSVVTVHLETDTGLPIQVQRPYTEWGALEFKVGHAVRVSWATEAAIILQET